MDSRKRVVKAQEQSKAAFDYILADAIGRSIGRLYSSSNNLPKIYELYPTLFNGDEMRAQEQAKKNEASIIRFKQFAQAHNGKYKGANNKE